MGLNPVKDGSVPKGISTANKYPLILFIALGTMILPMFAYAQADIHFCLDVFDAQLGKCQPFPPTDSWEIF